MSAPKKANVSRPREAITAGRPGRARSVPGGVRRMSGRRPTTSPAATPGASNQRDHVQLATIRAAPAAHADGVEHPPASRPVVGPVRRADRPEAHHRRHDERPGHGDEREQPEEHPPPADATGHPLGEHGTDQPGHHPRRREDGEHPRPLLDGERPADGDVADRRDHAGAEALDEATEDEHGHRRRQPADQEADGEQHEPADVRTPGAAPVGLVAGVDDADHRPEEERRRHPAVPGDPAEVVLDVGQDRDHGERLERHERDDGDEADAQRPQVSGRHGRGGLGHVRHRRTSTALEVKGDVNRLADPRGARADRWPGRSAGPRPSGCCPRSR